MKAPAPTVTIRRTFRFESAHRLPNVAPGHKCGRLHGHSYRVEVALRGPVQRDGMLVDFARIDAAFAPLREQLDHHYLNEVEGLENPTSENLAVWVYDRLVLQLGLYLHAVTVRETCASACTYRGEHS